MANSENGKCPECSSLKVFLCSGGYYICNDCEWFTKKEAYDADAQKELQAGT